MKFVSMVVIANLLIPTQFVFAEKKGTFGCSFSKVDECKNTTSGSQDKQYCSYLKAHDKACIQEAYSAIAYTAVAAICTTSCVLQMSVVPATVAAGKAMAPYCKIGTQAVSIADALTSLYIATQVGKDIKDEQATLHALLSTGTAIGTYAGSSYLNHLATNSSAAATAATNAEQNYLCTAESCGESDVATQQAKADSQSANDASKSANDKQAKAEKTATCLQAGMNALMATMKWTNKAKLVSNAEDQLNNLKSVKTTPSSNLGRSNYLPMQNLVNGNAPAPDLADSRGGLSEVFVPGEDSLSRIGESYATAADGKTFPSMGKNDFGNVFQALKDKFGITPQQLATAMESRGPVGAISGLIGNGPGTDAVKSYLNDVASKAGNISSSGSNLAFDKVQNNSGSGKSSGSDNPFSGLFGDRGPAGINGGGASALNFGGFKGDIWHAGTSLSIFEIVSRKTIEVSPRLKK